tara:strand:+ start:566 stop:1420 length:855 start_codon:yes stop_codon:yes gene_type:complete
MVIVNILQLLRVKDWLKNLILFFPIIFAGSISDFFLYFSLIKGFFIFSIVSSFIYVLNDILDLKADRLHPTKKFLKPIAAGRLSLSFSYVILIILFLLITIFIFKYKVIFISLILYLTLSLSYNFFLKNIPFLELIILAIGYVIRIDAGSKLIYVKSSTIMLLCVFFLALFFIVLKRVGELNCFINSEKNFNTRKVLKYYSLEFLKKITFISATILIILLFIFVLTKKIYLILILPFVLVFLLRYYLISNDSTKGESPISLILEDKLLLMFSLLSLSISIIIYL